MEFFICLPGDDKKSFIHSSYCLGEKSFNVFWAAEGLRVLLDLANKNPEKLKELEIMNSDGKKFTVEEFLSFIERLEVRANL